MKKMTFFCWSISMCIAFTLCSCGNTKNNQMDHRGDVSMTTEDLVKVINENSDFGAYTLLEELESPTQAYYDETNPERFIVFDDSGNRALEGTYYQYPRENEVQRLTFIWFFSDAYQILGLRVGSSVEQADKILTSYDFVVNNEIKEQHNIDAYFFENGNVTVRFEEDHTENHLITNIQVSVVDPWEEADGFL